ncbi:hypothetical protein Tco_0720038 [Tanacetum coccineum]
MRKTRFVTVSDSQYVVFNGTEYAVLIFLNEYAVLDRKLDTPYPMEVDTPYRFIDQNSLEYGRYGVSKVLDTAYWGFLGVGTTFDIFQNILFPYSLNTAYWSSWIRRIGSCFLRGLWSLSEQSLSELPSGRSASVYKKDSSIM